MRYSFLANFALERFDEAEVVLAKMEALAGKNVPAAYRTNLEENREKFQRELKIRRLEANTQDLPRVEIVTSEGKIVVELFENHAPNTVANFIHLVEQQFYDNKLFHLVRPGQFAVTGSPKGDGVGNAGYYIACECEAPEIRHHFRGTLTMLTSGKDQGGSQFMILHQPNTRLYDGRYTAFGRVVEGMDAVLKINNIDLNGRQLAAASSDASKIISATVLSKRAHPYLPEKIDIPNTTDFDTLLGTGNTSPSGMDALQGSQKKADSVVPSTEEDTGSFGLLVEEDK